MDPILEVAAIGTDNHFVKNKVIFMTKMITRRQILPVFVVLSVTPVTAFAGPEPQNEGVMILPPPDSDAAVQSEYDRVVQKGTREAYERFIRRHPNHRLADKAREALVRGGLE